MTGRGLRAGLWATSLLGGAIVPARAQGPASVGRAAWLAGCWRLAAGDRVIDEQWMVPGGQVMLGMSRTVRGGRVVEEERIRIHVVLGKLTYTAYPSGQAQADFTLSREGDSLLEFENRAHDFPQRIRYRRRSADSLVAQVEGTANGQSRVIAYPMARVRCEPPAG